jgi:hypothetical protein
MPDSILVGLKLPLTYILEVSFVLFSKQNPATKNSAEVFSAPTLRT